jgi:basic amino acid/polyamine antiporter, APA family
VTIPSGDPSGRLARRLTTSDAVMVGLGAMIGAGVFAAIGPAAEAAGAGLLVGLAIAAVVAYCNATSSAQLAAVHPESGGTYVYGRRQLGPVWGYLAGWGFVTGKTASCAAMALTFGAYAAPGLARPLALTAVVVLTAVNLAGVQKTAALTRVIVVLVLTSLTAVVVAALFGGEADAGNLADLGAAGPLGILRSAGLLFFAFAGYARIATLGEEVIEPERTIPRAVPLALGITLVVYAVVAVSALLAAGPQRLAASAAPLAEAIVGVSRTSLAMARRAELPRALAAVHPRTRVPHHAELSVAAVVCALVLTVDLRGAIGFSSFAVLTYYAITNAAAWTLRPEQRRWPRWLAGLGVGGCILLAVTLPLGSVLSGLAVFVLGGSIWVIRHR